jgi:hypothetical protein
MAPLSWRAGGSQWAHGKAPDFNLALMRVIERGVSQSSGSRAQSSQRGCLALVRELWCNDVTLGQPWSSCVHFIADALRIQERREIRVLKPQGL